MIKKIFITLYSLAIFFFALPICFAQIQVSNSTTLPTTEAPHRIATLSFKETQFDFGDVKQGEKLEHTFHFQNIGTSPLVLTNVITTCGCTATYWAKEPIAPQEKSEIKVRFDTTGKIGIQSKTITILSNASNQKERLTIRVNVLTD
jgi:hypothetical protein